MVAAVMIKPEFGIAGAGGAGFPTCVKLAGDKITLIYETTGRVVQAGELLAETAELIRNKCT